MIQKYLVVIFSVMLFSTVTVYAAEPIMITNSPDMDKVIFDGKWSFYTEWKRSSLTELHYDDGTNIKLRTAHQNNFIYIFVDVVSNFYPIRGSDSVLICLDGKDNKTSIANANDYCFMITDDGKNPLVLQGGSSLGFTSNFKKIPNPENFIGVGGVSDENDRYTKIPHPSYEFKIPTELVGRSDMYGFYLSVYDAHLNKSYSWPKEKSPSSLFDIPSPNKWGNMISPDKTLPEFELPLLTLLPAFLFVLYFTKFRI